MTWAPSGSPVALSSQPSPRAAGRRECRGPDRRREVLCGPGAREGNPLCHDPPTCLNGKCWLDDPEPRAGARQLAWRERRELEEKASRDKNGECCSSRRMDEIATTSNPALLADGLHGISDSLVIGSAIREHGTNLGDNRVSVDVNPSRNSRIADIKRRAADLFDVIETIGDEDPPSEIARLKLRAMTDIETGAIRAAKFAAQSGRRVTRLVTCRLVARAPRLEALRATPAACLDRCRPRDPNPTPGCVAPRAETASRHTLSTCSPHHAGRAKASDAAARWRRPSGLQADSTSPHPQRPRRPRAAPLRTHISASRHPVLTPLSHATLSHQTLLYPSTPAFAHSDPRGTPCTERLDGSPRARIRPRRGRKCPSRAPRRMHRHDSAPRACHAPRAQRALQHRRFGYNILWLGSSIIAKTG